MCLFFILLALGPRAALIVWWIAEPARFNLVFTSVIWPILGILLAPWTTLVYVLVAPGGVVGFDWLWLAIGVIFDLTSYTSGGVYGRRRGAVAA